MSVQQFQEACQKVKNLTKKPTDDELLELYGLYKQSTVGDNNTEKPSMVDFKNSKKWDSWNNRKGTSQEDAQAAYVELVKNLSSKYS